MVFSYLNGVSCTTFTSKGNFLHIPVFELTENRWKDEGVHVNSIVTINGDETIVKVICVKEFKPEVNIIITSKLGVIKKTSLEEFKVQRYTKPIKCMRLMTDDCCFCGAIYKCIFPN